MPWSVLGESVAGTSHTARNLPCQDAFRFRRIGDWLVVAVADGAGSASHADLGATRACDELVDRVAAAGPDAIFSHEAALALFAGARTALVAEAERVGVRPRELACTALL